MNGRKAMASSLPHGGAGGCRAGDSPRGCEGGAGRLPADRAADAGRPIRVGWLGGIPSRAVTGGPQAVTVGGLNLPRTELPPVKSATRLRVAVAGALAVPVALAGT